MIRKINKTNVPLTMTLAEDFATMPRWQVHGTAQGERSLSRHRVAQLRREHEAGRFRDPEWSVAWFGGKKFRMNGQHSSTMLAELNGSFPRGMEVSIVEYLCETEEDLLALFQSFDPPWSSRDARAYAGSRIAVEPLLASNEDVTRDIALRSGSAMAFHSRGASARTSARERAQIIHEDPAFVVAHAPYAKGSMGLNRLWSVGVGAAMYGTWEAAATATGERDTDGWSAFWWPVFHETDPNTESMTRVLARFLRQGKGRKDNTKEQMRMTYVKCLRAWNAWRQGKTSPMPYSPDSPIPEIHP